jgi:hypothetical protein
MVWQGGQRGGEGVTQHGVGGGEGGFRSWLRGDSPQTRVPTRDMFLGLPDPDPLGRCMDPEPSIIKQKSKKNLDSNCFVTFFELFIFEK